jgi:cyclic pyranopterin phosphate synthase
MDVRDRYHRPIKDLRISVTDRCNFRCLYCMPASEYTWVERKELLTFEEIVRLARIFVRLGVEKITVTGGEPLLRRNLEELIAQLVAIPGVRDLCLTTNGALLAERAARLRAAGLPRVNVSLDTLDAERFRRITQRGELGRVLEGLFEAKRVGLHPVKINAVIERGVNEEDIIPLARFALDHGFALRFIEYMDVGTANGWRWERVVPKAEILRVLAREFSLREIGREHDSDTAVRYQVADGRGDIGIIASVTEPFCRGCTRVRLTSDGKLVTCLFSTEGYDLKALVRGNASDEEILAAISGVWAARRDRYSEERWEALRAGRPLPSQPRLEMIRLGG